MHQTVRRVRVDVVVTDAHGRPVPGLNAEDFHVAEDGKPQPLRQFEWHDDNRDDAPPPKLPKLPDGTFVNLPAASERGPLTVVLYDMLNTPLDDQLLARAKMVEFLRSNENRRMAIFVLADRLHIVQGFTADSSLLARAVLAINPMRTTLAADAIRLNSGPYSSESSIPGPPAQPAPPQMGVGASREIIDPIAQAEKKFNELIENEQAERQSQFLDQRVYATLDAMKQIGRYLADFEGRKNLIWYSGAFPVAVLPDAAKQAQSLTYGSLIRDDASRNYSDRLRSATDQLTAAEVAVYPVNARGLTGENTAQSSAEIGTMQLLSEQTGGRAFYNTNALTNALESAAVDGSSYYSLLYAPTNLKFDGKIRHIKVTLDKSGLSLAYRRTYFADDLQAKDHPSGRSKSSLSTTEPLPADEEFGAPLSHDLIFSTHIDAIGSPAQPTPEQLAALRPYQEEMARAEHHKHSPREKPQLMQQYAIQYSVLSKLIEMQIGDDKAYHSDLVFSVLAYDENGATLWGTSTRLKDAIPPARVDQIRRDGFRAFHTFFVPINTTALRLAVRDQHSGKSGSMEIRLPLGSGDTR